MKYLKFSSLDQAKIRADELLQDGKNLNLFSGTTFCDILEFAGFFYIPYLEKFSQIYTAVENSEAAEISVTREDELLENKKTRERNIMKIIAQLEADGVGLTDRNNFFVANKLMLDLYPFQFPPNNVLLDSLNDSGFTGQYAWLTNSLIEKLKTLI